MTAPVSSRPGKDRGWCEWLQWVLGETPGRSSGWGIERAGELRGGGDGSGGGCSALRTMCGLRTGGCSLPGVMSD
jgi:hypothetical protein